MAELTFSSGKQAASCFLYKAMSQTFSKPHAASGANYCKLVLILSVAIACRQRPAATAEPEPAARDTTITQRNAYSDLFFDSVSLEQFIEQRQLTDTIASRLRRFYAGRNYQYAWFHHDGFTEQATLFWNLQSHYISYSRDSALYNPALQQLMDSSGAAKPAPLQDSTRLATELALTGQFARYARRAYQGNIPVQEKDLGWFIPRKQINTAALLDSFLKSGEASEPVNAQYGLLKKFLLRYYDMQRQGGWPAINGTAKKYQIGDSSAAVAAIKKRLFTTGDFAQPDSTGLFTDSLKAAVKRFQKRYGLNEDGVAGGSTLKALSEPIEQRIRQILINMERMRWVPAQPQGDFILVNIPQFKLTAFEKGKPAFDMNIVVGKAGNATVVFTGNLKHVVFSPYWNIPPGILKSETLPAIRRSSSYLARNHMEWNGGAVRQKPGPWNALGQVKFLFPNSYAIYLHDTPAKTLFGAERRAFSHGCIRVSDPEKLADWVLRNQPAWTFEKVRAAMNAGKEQYVPVTETIPVFIGYFTAYVDAAGQLNFRDDIYGHDGRLAARLFAK